MTYEFSVGSLDKRSGEVANCDSSEAISIAGSVINTRNTYKSGYLTYS